MTGQAPSDIVVRPARDGDWDRLWPLLVGMGQVDAPGKAVRRFRRVIENDAEFLSVAEWQGELTGYAWAHQGPVHLRAGRSSVRLNDQFVAPRYRCRGVGRILFVAVLQWATACGADWLEWQASAAALPFYARLGYTGQPERDPDHPFFEVTLAPELAS
jgi:GNAT superfamily N-acetyltransferase